MIDTKQLQAMAELRRAWFVRADGGRQRRRRRDTEKARQGHDDYADGSGKAPLTFQMHNSYGKAYAMKARAQM